MSKKKVLYMAVTADRYELPLAVEDTAEKLAKKLQIGKSAIYNSLDRGYNGSRSGYKFIKLDSSG